MHTRRHHLDVLPFLLLFALAACAGDAEASAARSQDAGEATGEAPEEKKERFPHEVMLKLVSPAEAEPGAPRGLRVNEPGAYDGVTLYAPLNATVIYLIDMQGEVVHEWETGSSPGAWCYLLEDGSLLHMGREDEGPKFRGGGIGGRLRRFAPDGTVLWSHDLSGDDVHQHHDLEPLPNGNLLAIAWERKSAEEAIARGRHPEAVGAAGLWPDAVYELRPTPPEGAEVVWEWHAWDHLVQDVDPEKPNHGRIAEHPGRIDVNAAYVPEDELSEEERAAQEELEAQMAALGYGGGDDDEEAESGEDEEENPRDKSGDWMHTNAVAYHPGLDLIALSSPELCEVFVIDHSTTTAEAAGSTGGRWGKGGDLLWRWGNPANHGAGAKEDRALSYQHDPTWLGGADDLRLLVFDNGGLPEGGGASRVLELVLPFEPDRGFLTEPGKPHGPAEPAWSYSDPETFFSAFISGAQRLPNGNTLVCSGVAGRLFEVTRDGRIVWDYWNPRGGEVIPPEHAGNAPPLAVFRAKRLPRDHPGVVALTR